MIKRLHEIVEERRLELIEWQKDPDEHRPISTGITALDDLFGGFPRYPFYFALIGRMKSGKSTVGLNLTLALCANSQKPTILYTLEESNREVADRVIAKSTSVGRSDIFNLRLTYEMFQEMTRAVEECKEFSYYVNDHLSNLTDILTDAKKNKVTQIIIDNFQLLTGGKGQSKREQLEYLSQQIMRARQEGMTIFLVSQGNDKDGSFGSEQVLKDANIVVGIDLVHIDSTDKNSAILDTMRRLTVRLSRFSSMGTHADIFFDGEHSRILQLETVMPDDIDFYIRTLDKHGSAEQAIVEPAIPEPEMEENLPIVIGE